MPAANGMLRVRIPEGTKPGDTIPVLCPDGRTLPMILPQGVSAGQLVEIPNPAPPASQEASGQRRLERQVSPKNPFETSKPAPNMGAAEQEVEAQKQRFEQLYIQGGTSAEEQQRRYEELQEQQAILRSIQERNTAAAPAQRGTPGGGAPVGPTAVPLQQQGPPEIPPAATMQEANASLMDLIDFGDDDTPEPSVSATGNPGLPQGPIVGPDTPCPQGPLGGTPAEAAPPTSAALLLDETLLSATSGSSSASAAPALSAPVGFTSSVQHPVVAKTPAAFGQGPWPGATGNPPQQQQQQQQKNAGDPFADLTSLAFGSSPQPQQQQQKNPF